MSKYIDEIIEDLKNNPKSFKKDPGKGWGCGVKKDDLEVIGGFGIIIFPLISVYINGSSIPISYIDKIRVYVALKIWYKQIPLEILID